MSLMNKIEIISDKVNEMKSKLGLPMSASLQNIVDNMDMGGDAYLGLLPTNATITCVATGDCGIKITVAGVDRDAAGVRVYWQKGSIPDPYEGNVLDFPAGVTTQIIPNLEVDTLYGFRCATYIEVDNKRVYNNAQNIGSAKLCKTLFVNENIIMIDLPEVCIDSTYHMNYSKYTNTAYLVSNNKFYKLNKDYTWSLEWDASAEGITLTNGMFISSHGIFLYHGSYSSSMATRLYKEDTGEVINTGRNSSYFNNPFETARGEVFATVWGSYDNRNGIYLFNPETNTWSNNLVSKCTHYAYYDGTDGVYFVTDVYNAGNQGVFKYDSIKKEMIQLHGSNNIDNTTSYTFRMLENGLLLCAQNTWDGQFFFIHNDTVYAGGLKSSAIDRFYYDADTDRIYYSDADEYLCYIHEDLISRTRLSTKACWTAQYVHNGRLYVLRTNIIMRLNADGTLTEITGQSYDSNGGYRLFTGADGWLYYNSGQIYAIDETTNKATVVKKGTSSVYTYATARFIANGKMYISSSNSNYGTNGLYQLHQGALIATGLTGVRNWARVKEVDASHCIVVSIYNGVSNTDPQYLLNTDDNTVEKIPNAQGGGDLYQGKFFLNNQENMIYGYGEALYPVCTVDLTIIDVGNPYFKYAAQVNNVGLQAVLVNTFANLVLLKGRSVQQYVDDIYQERGYRAFNDAGDDITDQVVVDTSGLNTTVPGTYSVLYSVEADGVVYKDSRTVEVLDAYEWANTLSNMSLLAGNTYTPPAELLFRKNNDRTVTDISEHVVMSHNIDYNTPGSYEVTFSCNYIYGIEATKTIIVTILGLDDISIANYNTAVDAIEGGLVTKVTKSGSRSLNTSKYISAPSSLYGSSGYVEYTLPSLKEFDITINFYKANSDSYPRLCYLIGPNREIEVKGASDNLYIGAEVSGGWLQNQWNQLRITRDANHLITYYMNGKQIHTETKTELLTGLRVGCGSSTSGNLFNGYIDDVTIVNTQPFDSYKYWFAQQWTGNADQSGNNNYYVGFSNTLPSATNYTLQPIDYYLSFTSLALMEQFLDTYDTTLATTIKTTTPTMYLNDTADETLYSNFDIYNDGVLFFAKNTE